MRIGILTLIAACGFAGSSSALVPIKPPPAKPPAAASKADIQDLDVILVSDPFHMLRLSILARRFGLAPRTSPTRTSPISANHSEFWRYTLQESWKAPVAFFFEFYDR